MSEVVAGLSISIEHQVGDDDTAIALGSGDLPVLATPQLVAWLEGAAVAVLGGRLDAGSTSVGGHISVDHLAPTAVGATVVAEVAVTAVDGRRIEFAVAAAEGTTPIASGTHVRYIVDADRFMAQVGA
jgi:predicted thioesterase